MNVSVEVTPASGMAVQLNLRGYKEGAQAAVSKGIKEATHYLQRYIETKLLSGQVLKVRTGTLRRSLMSRLITESNGDVGIVSVGKEAWYGKLHEFGFHKEFSSGTASRFGLTSAFGGTGWEIRAKGAMSAKLWKVASIYAGARGIKLGPHQASALRFKIGGKWVFAKSVQHPGLKQRSFMARGLSEATPAIRRIINNRLRQELAARRKATP